jgi:hypothetical protein
MLIVSQLKEQINKAKEIVLSNPGTKTQKINENIVSPMS